VVGFEDKVAVHDRDVEAESGRGFDVAGHEGSPAVPERAPREPHDAFADLVGRQFVRRRGHVHALTRADRRVESKMTIATLGRDRTFCECFASGNEIQSNSP
jgi:hypothetical protein